ncbi:hypothetical protein PYCC9005_004397 [Savitreella phatthalungensis]
MSIQPPLRGHETIPADSKIRRLPVHLSSYRASLYTASSKVDYVVEFLPDKDAAESALELDRLLQAIESLGLRSAVRESSSEGGLLIFIKCPDGRLAREVFRARQRDWLAGIRLAVPEVNQSIFEDPITDAERLRLVHLILTAPEEDGGAALTPGLHPWRRVHSIFPLHNKEFDDRWLRRWSTKWLIDDAELEHVRNHFGTKVAMYFAFLQFYLRSLFFPASLGLFSFFFLREVSAVYASLITVWGTIFIALWQRRELELATRWDVRECSRLEHRRAAFQREDSMPLLKLVRESVSVPFAIVCGAFLACVLTFIFCVEVWMGEVYDGPLKQILVFSPTVLFTLLVGPFSSLYMRSAEKLTSYENHATDGEYSAALSRKAFVLNFMTSYTALFLTQYVYLPFGHLIVPRLDVFGITTAYAAYGVKAKAFVIDGNRLRNQLFYFAVTAQLVNLAMELVVPYVLRLVRGEAETRIEKYTGKRFKPLDVPEEKAFLDRVRAEAGLPEHNLYTEYSEMVTQYGYTAMWSPIWPLTPLCALINNVVELRADAAKLCKNMRRPIPGRADSIGPWIENLQLLTWLGSITMSSSVYLLQGDAPSNKPLLHLLAVCFAAEHGYMAVRKVVSIIVGRVAVHSDASVRAEERQIRQEYLERHGSTGEALDALVSARQDQPDPFFSSSNTRADAQVIIARCPTSSQIKKEL